MLNQDILALIKTKPGITRKEILDALPDAAISTVGRIIDELRDDAFIVTIARGVYRAAEEESPKPAPSRSTWQPGGIGGPSLARLMAGR